VTITPYLAPLIGRAKRLNANKVSEMTNNNAPNKPANTHQLVRTEAAFGRVDVERGSVIPVHCDTEVLLWLPRRTIARHAIVLITIQYANTGTTIPGFTRLRK
jgi:hypothetical protein